MGCPPVPSILLLYPATTPESQFSLLLFCTAYLHLRRYLPPVVHCLNAPEPPAEANLTLRDYDPLSPRRRGGHLNYTCTAGGHNKFASDYTKRRYTLTCNDDNNYETPNWPTCVSSRCCRQILFKPCLFSATYCPEPETLETAEIRFHSSNSSITAGLD